jgi:hypothetical protein
MSTRNIPGSKCGRCVRLTTSPFSRVECHEIWEPKPPGTFWDTPGLLRDSFYLLYRPEKTCKRNGGTLPQSQPRSSMQLNDQLYGLPDLQPRKEHQQLLKRRLFRSQGRSGNFGVQKNLSHLPGIEPQFLCRLAYSIVTVLTCPVSSDRTVFCENNVL